MKKIGISFKETEVYMIEHLKKQLSISIYIKELIKKDIEDQKTETNTSTKINKNEKKKSVSFDW